MTLGSTIASARKRAGMSLDDLAERTSIRASLLREFENDNFEKCGGETYARGHVRNVAVALNCDPLEFLELFDAEQSTASRSMYDLLVENNVTTPKNEKNRISIKTLAIISASALVLVGGGQLVISNMNSATSAKKSPSAPTAPAKPTVTPTPQQSVVATGANAVTVQLSAAHGSTWLLVSDSAGTILYSGRMAQGENKTFSANEKINVRFGNAGAVDVFVNGKPEASLGAVGEVVDRTFEANSSN
ncbi:unannotated protein [freshwater metagenome]|uniref:Unannotated protein n=1 Tax=freshwater metagenome TaxID=449393 RepID=A0A6J7QRC7_9ZZZZ|nr:DUF4115 domain-containing protein [Actinomycetota bacterium]MSW23574.1 DUF4115 domain-containing protein [Actinomycetota bacterium]MSW75200.1 DUF4115 domain-containing protein [Actinomycetota bacterium]